MPNSCNYCCWKVQHQQKEEIILPMLNRIGPQKKPKAFYHSTQIMEMLLMDHKQKLENNRGTELWRFIFSGRKLQSFIKSIKHEILKGFEQYWCPVDLLYVQWHRFEKHELLREFVEEVSKCMINFSIYWDKA